MSLGLSSIYRHKSQLIALVTCMTILMICYNFLNMSRTESVSTVVQIEQFHQQQHKNHHFVDSNKNRPSEILNDEKVIKKVKSSSHQVHMDLINEMVAKQKGNKLEDNIEFQANKLVNPVQNELNINNNPNYVNNNPNLESNDCFKIKNNSLGAHFFVQFSL